MTTPDSAFYWDWYKHEENLYTSRGNFFLLGQSMLFAGYAALRAAPLNTRSAIVVFCILGLSTAFLWVLVGTMHQVGVRARLTKEVDQHEPRRPAISGRWPAYLGSFTVIAFAVPATVIVAWAVLLVV